MLPDRMGSRGGGGGRLVLQRLMLCIAAVVGCLFGVSNHHSACLWALDRSMQGLTAVMFPYI
jgi:hypothetical protein